jgi:hypothetical protein
MLLIALTSLALAGPPPTPVTLSGGISGVAGPGSGGGLSWGRVLFHSRFGSLDLGGSEGWASGESRHMGAVAIGVRRYGLKHTWAAVRFYHHHETPQQAFVDNTVSTLLGQNLFVVHRSGVQGGVGIAWDWRNMLDMDTFLDRWSTGAELTAAWMPASEGPNYYIGLELMHQIHVGPWKTPPR